MDAGIAIIAAAAGFVAYKHVSDKDSALANPNKPPKQPFWNEWMNSGNEPQTGNGNANVDQTGHDVANVVTSVSKFATSLLQYFGTAQDNDSPGSGVSTGGPTAQYSDGEW